MEVRREVNKGNLHLHQEDGDDSKSLETVINGDGRDLNLHYNLTRVYCAFPGNLLSLTSHREYLLSLAEDGI